MEKVQWNSINKKQNGLKQSKNEKSCTLPWDLCYDTDLYCNNNNKPWLSPPPMRGSKICRVKLIVTYVPGLSTLSRSLHSHSSVAQVHLHTIHPARMVWRWPCTTEECRWMLRVNARKMGKSGEPSCICNWMSFRRPFLLPLIGGGVFNNTLVLLK